MTFSLVIPTLNEEKYLPKLLSDLSRQTFSDFEVIVVDAKSTDQTLNQARRFSKRLKLKLLTSNRRHVSTQRNLGASHAKGTWTIFFDADVRITSSFLYELDQRLKHSPTVDGCTLFASPDKNSLSTLFVTIASNLGIYLASLINQPLSYGYAICLKTPLFKKLKGFDEHVSFQEDALFVQKFKKFHLKFAVFANPKVTMSFRRFRKEGFLPIALKFTRLSATALLRGPIKNKPNVYIMEGGAYYDQKQSLQSQSNKHKSQIS